METHTQYLGFHQILITPFYMSCGNNSLTLFIDLPRMMTLRESAVPTPLPENDTIANMVPKQSTSMTKKPDPFATHQSPPPALEAAAVPRAAMVPNTRTTPCSPISPSPKSPWTTNHTSTPPNPHHQSSPSPSPSNKKNHHRLKTDSALVVRDRIVHRTLLIITDLDHLSIGRGQVWTV